MKNEERRGWNNRIMMDDSELRRNCLTIRFKDDEHKVITDEAWRNRQSASKLIRDIVLGYLHAEGIMETNNKED